MAQNYMVIATVKSLGEITQINYTDKNTNQPKVLTKFQLELQIGDELKTIESLGFHRAKLVEGSTYELEIEGKDNPDFLDSLRVIKPYNPNNVPANQGKQAPQTTQAPATQANPQPTSVPNVKAPLKVDFASRWREWNTNFRLSNMQATERVGKYIDLLIAGKLLNSEGETVDKVQKSTIENWWSEEIDRFWNELEIRVPEDTFGKWEE